MADSPIVDAFLSGEITNEWAAKLIANKFEIERLKAEIATLKAESLLLADRTHRLGYKAWGMPTGNTATHVCKECGSRNTRDYEGYNPEGHPKDGRHEDDCTVGLAGRILATNGDGT